MSFSTAFFKRLLGQTAINDADATMPPRNNALPTAKSLWIMRCRVNFVKTRCSIKFEVGVPFELSRLEQPFPRKVLNNIFNVNSQHFKSLRNCSELEYDLLNFSMQISIWMFVQPWNYLCNTYTELHDIPLPPLSR